MTTVMGISAPPWTRSEILENIDEFAALYADRPVKDNRGGMKAPHMFALWFMARKLAPDFIVASGIWKGQSTWLLEKACAVACLFSIDLDLKNRDYISDRAVYFNRDFAEQDWSMTTGRSLVFFDDHQNAYKRLQQCRWFGFRHVIFEDNYPPGQGDSYSLKQAFANADFDAARSQQNSAIGKLRKFAGGIGQRLLSITPQHEVADILPNNFDSHMLQKHLDVYQEFPPVFKTDKTWWGDDWDEISYPTPEALLQRPEKPGNELFLNEAEWYTWICYVRLK